MSSLVLLLVAASIRLSVERQIRLEREGNSEGRGCSREATKILILFFGLFNSQRLSTEQEQIASTALQLEHFAATTPRQQPLCTIL